MFGFEINFAINNIFRDGAIVSRLPFGSRTIIMLFLEKNDDSNIRLKELLGGLISSGSKKIWATHFVIHLQGNDRDAENILKVAWSHRILKLTVVLSDAKEAGARK